MNDAELPPPLPASAEALLRSERGRPGIPDSARRRIAHRLAWAVGTGPAGELETINAELPGWRTRWSFLGRGFRAALASIAVLGPIPLAAAGVGAASVVGLGLRALVVAHQEARRPMPPIVGGATAQRPAPYVVAPLPDLPTLPSTPAVIPPSEPIPAAPPAVREVAPRTPAAPAPILEPTGPAGAREVPPPEIPPPASLQPHRALPLATEGVLLDRARSALSQKNPAEALERIAEHRMNYPDSQLAEEREFLSVEAELAAGNVGEARFRAEEFQRRFPHSLLLPRVQAALARLH